MHCGVDEAGRGSVMGPLVVGAVWVEDDDVLSKIGVRDSKKLTPKTRKKMYDMIVERADAWTTVMISASDIDARRKEISLNDIELDMFSEAISAHPCDIAYADCPDVNEDKFSARLGASLQDVEIIAKHKADDMYPVVSAASIVAKVTRDRIIEELHVELGDFGSGYPSDHYTMDFITDWMKENNCPPPHTRRSWEPVRQMISAKAVRRLDEW
ncbi:ribonuclease HII [Candidatus Methanoprimaticola sp. MG2]|uniref:ribonuclease HII n=1 Tax=Candidatus Methanoprimaticola sp. MG2 TaxID=3228838 RepID=UPI0039C6B06A